MESCIGHALLDPLLYDLALHHVADMTRMLLSRIDCSWLPRGR